MAASVPELAARLKPTRFSMLDREGSCELATVFQLSAPAKK
jgi:hypothetical protein